MKASINFILFNGVGQKMISRWKEAAIDTEGKVLMTTFDEDLSIERGDVLIAEIHFQEEPDDSSSDS